MANPVLWVALLAACGRSHGDGATAPASPMEAGPPPAAEAAGVAAAAPAPPSPPMTEAAARALLAGALRERGLRILQDVRVQGAGYDVTLDGWDPARRIGFEYIAPEEVDTDVDDGERRALAADPSLQVLVLDAVAEPAVQGRLQTFADALH
jgi:hypothetical protein